MFKFLKTLIKKHLSHDLLYKISMLINSTFGDFSKKTWAQHGEDVLIENYFKDKTDHGFYLDIGAHHPLRYSNTYRLYRLGWSGIAVDPLPGLEKLFRKFRPRDTFVNAGIGESTGVLKFYEFHDKAVSTFDAKQADEVMKTGRQLKSNRSVPIFSVEKVLEVSNAPNKIDVVNIDAEGMDELILNLWPFNKYQPDMFVVERFTRDKNTPISLLAHGYSYYARSGSSYFYTKDV